MTGGILEAVENQSPDIVIVDELSNPKEVYAAQTIAQRGIMLIATAHGSTLPELVHDRERTALVDAIASVTLSGREANERRDGQKQVLKRSKEPGTFLDYSILSCCVLYELIIIIIMY